MNEASEQDKRGRSPANIESLVTASRSVPVVDNRIDSRELFVATREITIGHGSDIYRLRLTAQNKLILTK
jgi:hemin uptake protein HemP